MKSSKQTRLWNPSRPQKIAEIASMLRLYNHLSEKEEFIRDCRAFNNLDKRAPVGDRRVSEAVVSFYLKWKVYPIPYWLLSDVIFRETLERFFERKGLVIRISPLSTKRQVLESYRQTRKNIRLKRFPRLSVLRLELLYKYLMDHAAFHSGFTAGEIAEATGSKPMRGKIQRERTHDGELSIKLSNKELNRADRLLEKLTAGDVDYSTAYAKAIRQVTKLRWKEPKRAPEIRMATRRALQTLKNLLSDPNI